MNVQGDYDGDGYVSLPALVPKEVAQAFLGLLKSDLDQSGVPLSSLRQGSHLLKGDSIELYAYHYPPMLMFLWGLTPTMVELTRPRSAADLRLPAHLQEGRHLPGPFRPPFLPAQPVAAARQQRRSRLAAGDRQGAAARAERSRVSEDFEAASFASIPMQAGDAVLYKGTNHRHGRITPNPNAWSAHLFLHWVDRGGPYAQFAFDGQQAYLKPLHFG